MRLPRILQIRSSALRPCPTLMAHILRLLDDFVEPLDLLCMFFSIHLSFRGATIIFL